MRIRKRLPVPPPSSPSPSPSPSSSSSAAQPPLSIPSDPQLQIPIKSSNNPTPPPLHPPNQQLITGSANPRWGFLTSSSSTRKNIKNKRDKEDDIRKEDEQQEEEGQRKSNTRNDSRKVAELDASAGNMHVGQTFYPSSSSTGDDDDDHKVNVFLPLKKRKEMSFFDQGNIINVARELETNSNREKDNIDPKMKCKTNEKSLLMPQQIVHSVHHQEDINIIKIQKVVEQYNGANRKKMKAKKVRGSEIMEGSRCSRVNGRGWRCWQQTLVGYALCEHHLGKGRLRSRSTSTNRVCSNHNQIAIAPTQLSSTLIQGGEEEKAPEMNRSEEEDDHEEQMKMGNHVVKARSISSLLGQTNDNVDNNNRVVTSSST